MKWNNSSSGWERGKKALCGNSKIAHNVSKRPLFPSAACFESEPGLEFRRSFKHAFNWAPVGWVCTQEEGKVLSECKSLVAVSFNQNKESRLSANTKWENELALMLISAPSLKQEMWNLEFTDIIINPNICRLGWVARDGDDGAVVNKQLRTKSPLKVIS